MKNRKKKLNGKARIVKYSFTGNNITRYAGMNTIHKFMNEQGLVRMISKSFPTRWHNATKFGAAQVMMSIVMASLSGVARIKKIVNFSGDGLGKVLLRLDRGIDENAISSTLKKLGENGARRLQALLLSKNAKWLRRSKLERITLDADSTVKTVCGSQEGAAKGFNPSKKAYVP